MTTHLKPLAGESLTSRLFDENKAIYEKMEKSTPDLLKMGRYFSTFRTMDKALGADGASCHWFAGRNKPSSTSKKAVEFWLALNEPWTPEPVPTAPPVPAIHYGQADETIYMVICPAGKAEKVQRVLTMLGCEVEEI